MSNSLNLLWVLSRNKKKEVNWSGYKGVSMSATLSRVLKVNYLCRKWCTTVIIHLGYCLLFRVATGVAEPL